MFSAESLPALSGSEKQLSWAKSLRIDCINAVDMEAMSLERQFKSANAQERAMIERLLNAYRWFFEAHLEARWWIENRQGSPHGWRELVSRNMEARLNADQSVQYDLFFVVNRGWKAMPKKRSAR